jgi:hypothetical protein
MNGLVALVDLIYEVVLDWPSVLVKLASATGAAMTSRDLRAGIFTTLSPRADPSALGTLPAKFTR